MKQDILKLSRTAHLPTDKQHTLWWNMRELRTIGQQFDSALLDKLRLQEKQADQLQALTKTTNEINELTRELARLDGLRLEIFKTIKPKNPNKKK